MMWWGSEYGMGWMWIPGVLFTLLVVAGIVALIVVATRSGRSYSVGPGAQDSARTILGERLARGEITPEQYRELLATLDERRSP